MREISEMYNSWGEGSKKSGKKMGGIVMDVMDKMSWYGILLQGQKLLHFNWLTHLVDRWLVLKHVESDGLRKRSALSNSDDITLSYVQEAWGAVYWYVLVSLLETSVLWDILKIITANDDSSLHFCGNDHRLQDTATDWYVSSEGTFFVNIWALNSLLWCLKTKTNTLVVSHALSIHIASGQQSKIESISFECDVQWSLHISIIKFGFGEYQTSWE